LYGVESGGEPYKTGFLTERGFYLISEVGASVIRGNRRRFPFLFFKHVKEFLLIYLLPVLQS